MMDYVHYYDPLEDIQTAWSGRDPRFLKPIEYFYQREFRVVITGIPSIEEQLFIDIPAPKGLFELELIKNRP